MTLKTKFRVMIALSAVGLLAVAGLWIQSQHSSLLSEKRQKTKNLVEVPYSIVERQYQLETEGKISRIEAQRRAIETIRAMRYEGNNYFWINDQHPTMIMHPTKPTGGPNALAEVLPRIPDDFPVTIVAVQHMPPIFTRLLAERLASRSSIPVEEGSAGVILLPGHAGSHPEISI
ncbi:MAG TPA: chemotaxis protein CheB [Terriglobales bacterium]|jgi:chemotaxis response regulator CheB